MRARRRLTLVRRWTVVACLLGGCAPVQAAGDSLEPVEPSPAVAVAPSAWPCRLVVANDLRPRVMTLWEGSPTFRQQCARIGRAGATVLLRTANSVQIQRPALSRIGTSADGVTIAQVFVQMGADTVEHIGHELEHVVEYLDKVDLRQRLVRHGSGVTVSSVGYETDQAIDAGTRVAREVRESRR
jgi:hypothetical protein